MSIDVSKMLKEHFTDFESHSVTHPSLQGKLQILDGHLARISKASKGRKGSEKRG
jgi:hypothetical protein